MICIVVLHGICLTWEAIGSCMHGSYAMVQVVSPQPHVMEAQLQYQVSPHGICSGQSGTWVGVSRSTSVSFCEYQSTNGGYPFIHQSPMVYDLRIDTVK
jgi:hypothetical protein